MLLFGYVRLFRYFITIWVLGALNFSAKKQFTEIRKYYMCQKVLQSNEQILAFSNADPELEKNKKWQQLEKSGSYPKIVRPHFREAKKGVTIRVCVTNRGVTNRGVTIWRLYSNLTLSFALIQLSHFLRFFKTEENNSFPLSTCPSLYCPTFDGFRKSHASMREAVPKLTVPLYNPRCTKNPNSFLPAAQQSARKKPKIRSKIRK